MIILNIYYLGHINIDVSWKFKSRYSNFIQEINAIKIFLHFFRRFFVRFFGLIPSFYN